MRQTGRWIGLSLLGIVLVTGAAVAQTAPPVRRTPSTATTSTGGAFDQLSPGNQQIARALFEAQTPTAGTTPLTLNQIAALKQSGQGWGEVFNQMKAQGLVQDKNLGQVVSEFHHRHPTSSVSAGTHSTTRSGQTQVVGGRGKAEGSVTSADGSHSGNAFGRQDAGFSGGFGHSGGGFGHGGGGRGR